MKLRGSRRNFLVWSSTLTGALTLSKTANAVLSARQTNSTVAPAMGFSTHQVTQETKIVQGELRPYAWCCANGTRLELVMNHQEVSSAIQLTSSLDFPRQFTFSDFCCGSPQETIRRNFGNRVLEEVLVEIGRYSTEHA
ncbi:MAG: hypothetical protein GXP16_18880 [Gammaproteobacteria bacterium]|nr:hypothetical protein [Gammaproteobacteria bacterium]